MRSPRALFSLALFSFSAGCSPRSIAERAAANPPDPASFAGGSLPLVAHAASPVPNAAPLITIIAGQVRLNDRVIDDATNVAHDHNSPPVRKALSDQRVVWNAGHPGEDLGLVVVYRLDRTTRSRMLNRLVFHAGLAGFPNGCFVVVDPKGTFSCVAIGVDLPSVMAGEQEMKIVVRVRAEGRFRTKFGDFSSGRELAAAIAQRPHEGFEITLDLGDDIDLQALVSTAEALYAIDKPPARVTLAPP